MALTVTLYSFTKRENSTKRPTSGGTDYSCLLIDETSLMEPTFKLEIAANPISKNYAYVSDFNRYYFITDITSKQGFWYISCTCDVLATYKTEIGSQSHYVLRSASNYDEYISDNFYGAKVSQEGNHLYQSGPLWHSLGLTYVIGITGFAPSQDGQVGSVTYYQMDAQMLYDFCYFLMHDITGWCDIPTAQYDKSVQEALLNPIQYIVSCIALPIGFPSTYSQPGVISFGYYHWNISSSGHIRVLNMGAKDSETYSFSLPKHPQADTRGKFLNGAPYTTYTFHLGPFGDIPLDPSLFIDATSVVYKVVFDMATGQANLGVAPYYGTGTPTIGSSPLCYSGSAQVGVSIQLTQAIINKLEATVSWQSGLNNVVATGISGGVGLNTPSNLIRAQNVLQETYADAIKNRYPTACGKGSTGSFLSFYDNDFGCTLTSTFYRIVDENITEIGRPLCQTKQINTLSGFIMCQLADAQIPGTQEEAQKINAYLNSGFFYE